ncbi:MAG: primosomal protein N' [SAR202 cluster bacterium]|nr:primosomal protein N' [SAR202 cluster bacterium]
MKYVEVAVDAPLGVNRTLTYAAPEHIHPVPGQMVWVPLGQRPVQGVVFSVAAQTPLDSVRDIISTIEPSPLLSTASLEMARWISRYYISSLFEAACLMLPPGFRDHVNVYLEHVEGEAESLSEVDAALRRLVSQRGQVLEREALSSLGAKARASIDRLARRGFLRRVWRIPNHAPPVRYDTYLVAALPDARTEEALAASPAKKTKRALMEAALLRALATSRLDMAVARKEFGRETVARLLERGLAGQEWVREEAVFRVDKPEDEGPIILTGEQSGAVDAITAALEGKGDGPRTFLLHGVTGSGKTEVYLRALERCVAKGWQGLMLVPEISLTPQTLHRLNARFPGRVGVFHSRLSARQQSEVWWQACEGAFDVVVGPRSALFMPLPRLGLIMVDEEHDASYKEQERSPRFHARDVALKLGQLAGAPVVLGSATPDIASYRRALRGRHHLHELSYRVGVGVKAQGGGAGLASVQVVDMREELKDGNYSSFSRMLSQALRECVSKGEQAILFLNRRGAATLVQCRDCGHVLRCRSCDVSLTYHRTVGLLCHRCNRRQKQPGACPNCKGPKVHYLGLGTQKVSEELTALLPTTATMRWDADAVREAGGHEALMEEFTSGHSQVVVGTQMIAKGLHVPKVSLVGVVLADVGLYMPDFTSGERAFQLLCQVAGRAGRGLVPGRVIIQTYSPDNYAIQAASRQDYKGMYEKEIGMRQEQGNPPFSRIVHMIYHHTNEESCRLEAARFADEMRTSVQSQGLAGLEVVGPAPGCPSRVRGRYRWHLLLRGVNPHALLETMAIPKDWTVDVDPVSVL